MSGAAPEAADPTVVTDLDRRFMAAAIRLARRNLGATGPNPSVGAICVAWTPEGPVVVGRGVTAPDGRPHAEPQALAQAGDRARGSTLYVTLEPCSHWGKAPPCADAVVAAGVARVVVAMDDPDPRVSGAGYDKLRKAGITVVRGVLTDEARDGLAGFLSRVERSRPRVLLKLAVSADGHVGRVGVANLPITGPAARARAQLMRMEADAIAVGIGTATIDDPELTVRLAGLEHRSPMRVVFDAALALSPTSRLVRSARTVPTLVVTSDEIHPTLGVELTALGVRILPVAARDGRIDLAAALRALAGEGVNTLMLEGGAALAEAFLATDLVDRIALFRSPAPLAAAPEGAAARGEGTAAAPAAPDGARSAPPAPVPAPPTPARPVPAPPSLAPLLDPAAACFRRTARETCGPDLLEIWDRLPTRPT